MLELSDALRPNFLKISRQSWVSVTGWISIAQTKIIFLLAENDALLPVPTGNVGGSYKSFMKKKRNKKRLMFQYSANTAWILPKLSVHQDSFFMRISYMYMNTYISILCVCLWYLSSSMLLLWFQPNFVIIYTLLRFHPLRLFRITQLLKQNQNYFND